MNIHWNVIFWLLGTTIAFGFIALLGIWRAHRMRSAQIETYLLGRASANFKQVVGGAKLGDDIVTAHLKSLQSNGHVQAHLMEGDELRYVLSEARRRKLQR